MSVADLRKTRPIRYFLALTVYRAIWWPMVGIAALFAAPYLAVEMFNEKVILPAVRFVQPVWPFVREEIALRIGNAILGFKPERPQ